MSKKLWVLVVVCSVVAGAFSQLAPVEAASTGSVQDQINANDSEVAKLNKQIATYEAKLKEIGSDKKTLQAAIDSLNLKRKAVEAHIGSTQHTINSTELRIERLNTSIASTSHQISAAQATVSRDLKNVHQIDNQSLLAQMLSSQDISAVWQQVGELSQLDRAVQDNVSALRDRETKLATAKDTARAERIKLVTERGQLQSQQHSLTQTKQSKNQLLAETNSKESTYQKLLAKAKEQLASFSAFSQNAGGSGLLPHQTDCDSWGCYYNQRDAAWGNQSLNGTKYAIKSDGCLVTALAMVLTHYGYKDVTPVTINSNSGNFAAYYPAYLLRTVHIDGKTVTRTNASIDKTLAAGEPVIVGLHAYGGTHFVVLTSGSQGHYLMRDPYVANAKDVPFSSHYSTKQIYEINRVHIS